MSKARQLAFALPVRTAQGRDDFFVSEANRIAVAQVDAWPDWPQRRLVISGPSGAGKTHLARVWAARSGARTLRGAALTEAIVAQLPDAARIVLEDADAAPERPLLHLANLLQRDGFLLLTAKEPPARWRLGLADLRSRLEAAPLATLADPDDALLGAVILKLLADRQIAPPPDLVPFLVPRIERSFAAAQALVDRLDRESLARRTPLGVKLAGRLLREAG